MRHRKNKVTLDRKAAPRRALLKQLAESVILYEKVQTTEARARAVRGVVERLVTRAKEPTIANRRLLKAKLSTEGAVKKLLEVLGPRYKDRRGGYTRLTKLPVRQGDRARVVQIEFV